MEYATRMLPYARPVVVPLWDLTLLPHRDHLTGCWFWNSWLWVQEMQFWIPSANTECRAVKFRDTSQFRAGLSWSRGIAAEALHGRLSLSFA